jgi:predicted nucleic acid-binding protein
VTEAEIQAFQSNLRSFDVLIDRWPGWPLLDRTQMLAERHSLTAYDAAYLELAIGAELPLAARDSALSRAAIAENVAFV